MKLKHLSIAAAAILTAATAIYWLEARKPAAAPSSDPRVGSPLASAEVLRATHAFAVSSQSATDVRLFRAADAAQWFVTDTERTLPADFSRISRMANALQDATIVRAIGSNPQRIERLGLGRVTLSLLDAADAPLLAFSLGDSSERAGPFLQFSGENSAYALESSLFIDTTFLNWADRTPLDLQPEQVATIQIPFPEFGVEPILAARAEEGTDFVAQAGADTPLNQSQLTNFLRSLLAFRFTQIVERDDPAAQQAAEFARTFPLTLSDGDALSIRIGRTPERPAVTDDDGNETAPAQPAGTPYVFLDAVPAAHPWADAAARFAFAVSPSVFTAIPSRAQLLQLPPAPPAPSQD